MPSQTPNGFILLEVLVAMGLILGVWMTSVGAYQNLALYLTQQEVKRMRLWREFDAYERAEQLRANALTISTKVSNSGLQHESSRMSRRNRFVQPSAKSIVKN
jgi:Tfp pilus assembly protein PilV